MTNTKSGNETMSGIAKALAIVEHLADAPDGLSISELGRRLSTNKSIIFRVLGSLEACGYVYRSERTRNYHLTYKMSNLGLRQLSAARLIDQCVPPLRHLADETGEIVRLAVVDGERPVWIYSASGTRGGLQIMPRYGLDIVYHAHATGKAWLSMLPDERVRAVLGPGPFKKFTAATITTMRKLKQELVLTRKRGFALCWEEVERGVGAVAAPIVVDDPNDGGRASCRGIVALAIPTSRVTRNGMLACGKQVVETARVLADQWPLSDAYAAEAAPDHVGAAPPTPSRSTVASALASGGRSQRLRR